MTSSAPLGIPGREKGGAFFLHGRDEFRKEEAGRALVDWHLDPSTKDFNFDPIRGSEVDVESLASVLATPPMMAEWRVVLLREVEGLASSPRARDALLKIAKDPPPGLALIMLASIPRDSKAKFYRELKKETRSVEFQEIGANDVPGWLMEFAETRWGAQMDLDAARALGSGLGTDLGVLAQEVEKLAGLVDEGGRIDLELVKRAGTRIPSQDRWEWMDLVGKRQFRAALSGLPVLFSQGESGVYLTMGLATHFLRLGLARSGGKALLEEALPYHQKWLSRPLLQQAHAWSIPELEGALKGLRRLDRILKSSSGSETQLMEEWLLGLMVSDQAVAS